MSCRMRNDWRTNQDVETVNAAFAFIYDEPISGDSSPVPDDFAIDMDNVDVVVDEHFSFLNQLHDSDQFRDAEPIYANVRCSVGATTGPDMVPTKSLQIVDTSQKLDIHISNSGTNIQNGNTIINIPCESEMVRQTDPDDYSPRNDNYAAVYLDVAEIGPLEFQKCENELCGDEQLDNSAQSERANDEQCLSPDHLIRQSFFDQVDSIILRNENSDEKYEKEIEQEADKVIRRLTTDGSEGERTAKRFCPEYHSPIKDSIMAEPHHESDIEMDAFSGAIYVEPSRIQLSNSIDETNGPADRTVSTESNQLLTFRSNAEFPPDNNNTETNSGNSSCCEAFRDSPDSCPAAVTIDSPRRDEKNSDYPEDLSGVEIQDEVVIEAKNDILRGNFSEPCLETVSKDIRSAASHMEKLLHLDKEVESIDGQPTDEGAESPMRHEIHNESDRIIRLSCRARIAEAVNPNILPDQLENSPEVEGNQPEIASQSEEELSTTSSTDDTLSLESSESDEIPDVPQGRSGTTLERDQGGHDVVRDNKSSSLTESPKISILDDDLQESVGFAASVGRAIRLSMRRMRQIRISGRRSKRTSSEAYAYYNEAVVSEETEVRREVPEAPTVGLASVRSPAASAVLLPSIMAALAPPGSPTQEINTCEGSEGDSELQRSQSADSSEGHTYNRSDSGTGQQNDLAHSDRIEDEVRQQEPSTTPPPGYSVAIQGSSSLSASRSPGEQERLAQHEPLVESGQVPGRQQHQPRSSRGRTRRTSLERTTEQGRNVSRETLVHTDATPVSTVSGRSQQARRSVSNSSVETTSDPSLLNERRRQSRRSSPSRQSSHASSNISGFTPPKRELWPHSFSGLLASLPLTLNVFNISRFALFGAKYGWQFPIQWGIISLVFGLPLMVFHMAVGQLVGAGPIDMWVISPIFQGVGYGVLIAEALLGVYCCIPIAWMFTYFRESFDMGTFRCITSFDCENPHNLSAEINQVVPQFFVSNILARSQSHGVPLANLGTIHFNLAFNLLIIWIILFVALSRGAKTLGKICYLSTLLPFICFNVVCCYLIYIAFTQLPVVSFFPKFLDKQSWMAAAREAFLVWALHGAALQQLASGNRKGRPLWRDTTIIALLTGSGLFLASFCGIVCSTVLHEKTLRFSPSSFETAETRQMTEVRNWVSKTDLTYGSNKASHIYDMFTPQDVYDNFYVGVRIRKQFLESDEENIGIRSGYNSIRFLTEMFPALLFTLKSPIEATIPPLFYLSLLMFGLAHQISVWYAVIQGVIRMQYGRLRAIETFLTFCCCVFGFSAALPLATGAGMNVLYFLDFIVGSAWWLMILQLIYIFGILLVRGKPFSASDLANELFGGKGRMCGLKHSLSLCWTVLIPVGLVVATISSFQAGDYRQVFTWECADWPVWVCQLASALQLIPLILVPLFGIVKTGIFLSHPRHNFLQKLEFLYRPPPFRDIYQEDDPFLNEDADDSLDLFRGELISQANRRRNQSALNDPPPKYTPPPSYSTATGSSLAKSLENTVRRSFRYLRRHPSRATHSQLPP